MSEPRTPAGRFLRNGLMQLLGWDQDAANNAVTDIEDEAEDAFSCPRCGWGEDEPEAKPPRVPTHFESVQIEVIDGKATLPDGQVVKSEGQKYVIVAVPVYPDETVAE